jgi:hypothetical protein
MAEYRPLIGRLSDAPGGQADAARVQSPPMSNRSSRIAAANRAEARRRARYLAQGRELEESEDDQEPETDTARRAAVPTGGFLTRLFPAAPPLPGKPDPLAGFTYTGPLRGLVSGLYLLARNPRAWVVPAVIWTVAELMFRLGIPDALFGTIASLVAFGALIAAGWIGWQRPWAFGLAAAVLGVTLFTGILGTAAVLARVPGANAAYIGLASQELLQLAFGALAGWYGGYLRRRLAAAPSQARSTRRR